jgi:Zn-dependent protease with chaperone function
VFEMPYNLNKKKILFFWIILFIFLNLERVDINIPQGHRMFGNAFISVVYGFVLYFVSYFIVIKNRNNIVYFLLILIIFFFGVNLIMSSFGKYFQIKYYLLLKNSYPKERFLPILIIMLNYVLINYYLKKNQRK